MLRAAQQNRSKRDELTLVHGVQVTCQGTAMTLRMQHPAVTTILLPHCWQMTGVCVAEARTAHLWSTSYMYYQAL